MIYNSLDEMNILTALKYAAQGFEFIINDGHIHGMKAPATNKAAGEEAQE